MSTDPEKREMLGDFISIPPQYSHLITKPLSFHPTRPLGRVAMTGFLLMEFNGQRFRVDIETPPVKSEFDDALTRGIKRVGDMLGRTIAQMENR